MQGVLVSQIYFLQLIKYLLVNKSDVVLHRLVEDNMQKFLRLRIRSVQQIFQFLSINLYNKFIYFIHLFFKLNP
jgi:hypothetical protein